MELFQISNITNNNKFLCTGNLAHNLSPKIFKLKKITSEQAMEILWTERSPTYPIDYPKHHYELEITNDFVCLTFRDCCY